MGRVVGPRRVTRHPAAAPGPGAPGPEGSPDGGETAARLRAAVIRLHRRMRQQSLAGITPAQASALGSVNRLGRPTLGELAAAEQVQPPTMTKVAAQMEEAGLVTRVADDADRRVVRVALTAHGRRTVERIRRTERAYLAAQLAGLPPAERASAEDLVALLEHLLGGPA